MRVQPHPVFRQEGGHLHLEREIKLSEALLGTTIEVPTLLEEPRKVKVPAGTQPGARIRLPGLGMPGRGSSKPGDAFVSLRIALPKKLNKRQKKLVQELAEAGL